MKVFHFFSHPIPAMLLHTPLTSPPNCDPHSRLFRLHDVTPVSRMGQEVLCFFLGEDILK
jgi:hypothetical protein